MPPAPPGRDRARDRAQPTAQPPGSRPSCLLRQRRRLVLRRSLCSRLATFIVVRSDISRRRHVRIPPYELERVGFFLRHHAAAGAQGVGELEEPVLVAER